MDNLRRIRQGCSVFALFTVLFAASWASAQLSPGLLGKTTTVPPAEEAIRAEISRIENGVITLDLLPIPAVYLYRDKLNITSSPSSKLKLGAPKLPTSTLIDDEFFGKTHVYRGPQQVQIPYSGGGKASLNVTLVGCHAEAKVCYPPVRIALAIDPKSQLSPIKTGVTSSKSPQSAAAKADGLIRTNRELNHAIAQAKGKFIIVDFWATWCAPCKHMEKTTFVDADVKSLMDSDFVLLKVDVSKPTPDAQALLKRFSFVGPPSFAFFNRSGVEVQGGRMIGYIPPERFLAQMKLVAS